MLKTTLIVVLALAFVLPATSLAHNSSYAFKERAIRHKESGLRYIFNRNFPDYGPHVVKCRGLNPIRFPNGSRGYRHIRCRIETMSVPDFILHLGRRGQLITTRAWG